MFPIKFIVGFLFLILTGFDLPSHAEVWGADWKLIEKDEEGLWFYDSAKMECIANNTLQVQTKKIYEEKAVPAAVEKYGTNYRNLDHVLAIWEINCLKRTFKLRSAIFYSKDNTVIEGYQAEKEGDLTPEDIPPDSYLELLRKKICR
jgi:hypothetical protein